MSHPRPQTAIVTGATGQDGYFLVNRLLREGWTVHAPVRDVDAARSLFGAHERLVPVKRDLRNPAPLAALVGDVQPEELYNLAGESSVSASFDDPLSTWETNAHVVVQLLDSVRNDSPGTRFYQASSGEMFGSTPGGDVVHDEDSPLNPQSPYAAAKAAAHLLCRSYRESYGIRIACGVLFNHESHRRWPRFLSRKVVDHLKALDETGDRRPLKVGNLKAKRDWGYARDYMEGAWRMLQADEPDDYVLATGETHSVQEFLDAAFGHAGLDWNDYVKVDERYFRPAEVDLLVGDYSKAKEKLGWEPTVRFDELVRMMVDHDRQRERSEEHYV